MPRPTIPGLLLTVLTLAHPAAGLAPPPPVASALAPAKADPAAELRRLFTERWGEPTAAEEKLLLAATNGGNADYRVPDAKGRTHADDGFQAGTGANDPAHADKWGSNRVLPARVVDWLLSDPAPRPFIHDGGVVIRGARIEGRLDLQGASIPFRFELRGCKVAGGIVLRDARTRLLIFDGTHCGSLVADRLHADGGLSLRGGFRAAEGVVLLNADITGDLNCAGAVFKRGEEQALNAEGVKVSGNISLNTDKDDPDRWFSAYGGVRLLRAVIGGDLDCTDGTFANAGGGALNATGLKVGGGVFLNGKFKAEGEVRLLSGEIGGNLDCSGGTFTNRGEDVLNAEGLKVGGSIFFRDGFKAQGNVLLIAAKIERYFIWRGLKSPETATLDLRSAHVGMLWADLANWSDAAEVRMHGFTYDVLHDDTERAPEEGYAWLIRHPANRFSAQPYSQLATVLRAGGDERAAVDTLIAMEKETAKALRAWTLGGDLKPQAGTAGRLDRLREWVCGRLTWPEWLWYTVLGPRIEYGYKPWLVALPAAALVALGTAVFGLAFLCHLIVPIKSDAYVKDETVTAVPVGGGGGGLAFYGAAVTGQPRRLNDNYPTFNALVYALEMFAPLVDLHQGKFWAPSAHRGWRLLRIRGWSLRAGELVRVYMWLHILAGWVLTGLLVASLSGIVHK